MSSVKVRFRVLEAHLSGNADFTKRYGARVKALGGSYNEVRSQPGTRFLKMPAEHRDLIDEICAAFPKGNSTLLVARGLEAEGISEQRIERAFAGVAGSVAFNWDARLDESAFQALQNHVDRVSNKINWPYLLGVWAKEDAVEAARRNEAALHRAIAETKEAIAEAALGLLDGHGDVEGLMELARRLRELQTEASPGQEADLLATAPAPSPGF